MTSSILRMRERDRLRKQLQRMLARADDEAFLRMIWAADAIQSSESGSARERAGWRWFIRTPPQLVAHWRERPFLFKWRLETLANELFSVSKKNPKAGRSGKQFNCRSFAALLAVMDQLHRLEDAEDGFVLQRVPVLTQLHRLGQRQFPWQRNKLHPLPIYRTSFLYGFPEAETKFYARYGLTLADFELFAIGLYALLKDNQAVRLPVTLQQLGFDAQKSETALRLLALTPAAANLKARQFQRAATHIAYTGSVLRQTPLIRFPKVILAPLPELIIDRITDGIYYDIVEKGDVTHKIGKRFEAYCIELLTDYVPKLTISGEFTYGKQQHSPDILVGEHGQINVAIECKAKREPIAAKLGEETTALADAGIEELAKGIFQLWRFFSHVRRGRAVPKYPVDADAVGVLLMLDTWTEVSDGQRAAVQKRARVLATEKESEIIDEDCRPIAFCNIHGFENVVRRATEQDFVRTLRLASTPSYQGWPLEEIFKKLDDAVEIDKEDPFFDRMKEVVPWIRKLDTFPQIRMNNPNGVGS